jgi:hypothetical protein
MATSFSVVSPGTEMMAIEVTTGRMFNARAPTPLFQTPPGTVVDDVTRTASDSSS